jgi:alkylresorcinol/alkylpyrone synthase
MDRNAPVRVESVGTAVPSHKLNQDEARSLAMSLFAGRVSNVERYSPVFANAGIEQRYLSAPAEYLTQEGLNFTEKNALYGRVALGLGREAGAKALAVAGVDPSEVEDFVFVSTTGFVPGLDARLSQELGLSANARRVPLVGLGCAGGAAGLAIGMDHARAHLGRPVLVVAVEATSLTFLAGDSSTENLISVALFGDGAAAAVLRAPEGGEEGEGRGVELLGGFSQTWPETQRIMGWDIVDPGLKIVIDRRIPAFVREHLPENLRLATEHFGISREDLKHFVTHPGGARVLDAFELSLGLQPGALDLSRAVLRDYGNMSSGTVLFVLKRFFESGNFRDASPGDFGLISALGPGFSVEHVLFRTA